MAVHFDHRNIKTQERGFTLVEMAVVLVIFGTMLVAVITAFLSTQQRLKTIRTEERAEIIMDAVSAYASRNFRVPCPADPNPPAATGTEPFGAEINSGPNGTGIGNCQTTAGDEEGLVPYLALGLDQEDVRDGWGNYFTYRVSPGFTADPELANTAGGTQIHALCRTKAWLEGIILDGTFPSLNYVGGRNVRPLKAAFCCTALGAGIGAPASTDVQICGANVAAPCNNNRIFPFDRDSNAALYADVNTIFDHWDPPTGFGASSEPFYDPRIFTQLNATSIVYALISHGENETGAFLDDRSGNRIVADGGAREIDNGNTAQRIIWSIPQDRSADATRFDDIVRWQTQSQILSRLGGETCAVP